MIDFRQYLELIEGFDEVEYDFDDEFESISPFAPIEIGNYVLNLYASENDLCSPLINSINPYDYDSWEMSIEKKDTRYDYVLCTHKIFNRIGYTAFQPDDVYAAYVPTELVQQVFDYLVSTIKLPKLSGIILPKE
jgi:hypothetical protein